ncbi:hypothetical protein PTKIN_Ptkin14bG0230200 [Pterospermum kingtungense]
MASSCVEKMMQNLLCVKGIQIIEGDQDKKTGNKVKVIRCATELNEAGITFKEVDGKDKNNAVRFFDVKFENGQMKIPTLEIGRETGRLFYNLIAYELRHETSSCVTDYARLMYNLVKKADDVKLLRLKGIIKSTLADDEAVADMIKRLLDGFELKDSDQSFIYAKMFDDVKQYCDKSTWNTWKREFRHNYWNTPWRRFGLVAAVLLFLFSAAQIILAVLK